MTRICKENFGEEHFSKEDLPISASEDFGLYLNEIPGCFFLLGTMKEGKDILTLHDGNFDFNDDMIASGAYFFLKIVEDRIQ